MLRGLKITSKVFWPNPSIVSGKSALNEKPSPETPVEVTVIATSLGLVKVSVIALLESTATAPKSILLDERTKGSKATGELTVKVPSIVPVTRLTVGSFARMTSTSLRG